MQTVLIIAVRLRHVVKRLVLDHVFDDSELEVVISAEEELAIEGTDGANGG